jgi:hypothetical protein
LTNDHVSTNATMPTWRNSGNAPDSKQAKTRALTNRSP